MKKQAKLFFVSMLVFATVLLTGCSSAGVGYMGLSQDINAFEEYAISGDVALNVSVSGFGETTDSPMKIKYTGECESIGKYHINADVTVDGNRIPMEIYMDGEKALIDKEAVLKMAAQNIEDEDTVKNFEAELADIKWLDVMDIEAVGANYMDIETLTVLQENAFAIVEYFAYNSFDKFNPDIFSGSSSKGYTLKINDYNIPTVTQSFITYIRDNYSAVKSDVAYICGLFTDELQAMNLDTAAVLDVLSLFENIDNVTVKDTSEQVAAALKGTNISSTVKKSSNVYTQAVSGKLVINDFLGENTKVTVDITSNTKYNINVNVNIVMPTKGVSGLSDIAAKQTPYAIDGTFFMNDELMYLTKSYDIYLFDTYEEIEVKAILKDNYNYFPMRQISEMFGETVIWDKATGEIYVLRDGEKIDMSGFVQNYRTYVKLRDFEKLGYKIDYEKDPELGGIAYISYNLYD